MTFDEALSERYEIVRQLGSGGQGTVLQARDREHDNRYVALKIYEMTPELTREELSSETDVLLRLTPFPGLPFVRTDFFLDDRYVIVMDWIDGANLQDRLARHGDPGLPLAMVIDYISQAADSLEHLHTHVPPVFHGDVKPANLVLTNDGRIVLVDFGIAAEGMPRRTAGTAGTRGYRAPEVAARRPVERGRRRLRARRDRVRTAQWRTAARAAGRRRRDRDRRGEGRRAHAPAGARHRSDCAAGIGPGVRRAAEGKPLPGTADGRRHLPRD